MDTFGGTTIAVKLPVSLLRASLENAVAELALSRASRKGTMQKLPQDHEGSHSVWTGKRWSDFALGTVRQAWRLLSGKGAPNHLLMPGRRPDNPNDELGPYHGRLPSDPDVFVYRMSEAFSLGTVGTVIAALTSIGDRHKSFVLDFSAVAYIDTTGGSLVADVVRREHDRGVAIIVSDAAPTVRQVLVEWGVDAPLVEYANSLRDALPVARVRALQRGDW